MISQAGPKTERDFCEPGQVRAVPGTAVDAYVLGPPTSEGRLAQEFDAGEVYPADGEAEDDAAHAAGMNTARMPTIRQRLVMVPVRIAHHSRRRILHYPTHWPWQQEFMDLWDHATGSDPPIAA